MRRHAKDRSKSVEIRQSTSLGDFPVTWIMTLLGYQNKTKDWRTGRGLTKAHLSLVFTIRAPNDILQRGGGSATSARQQA
jgi:hypothetical protein